MHAASNLQHSITSIYVNSELTSSGIGYYADLSRSAAFQRFGVVRGAQPCYCQAPPRPLHATPAEPYMFLKTGSSPNETCFDTAHVRRRLSRLTLIATSLLSMLTKMSTDALSVRHSSVHSSTPGRQCPEVCHLLPLFSFLLSPWLPAGLPLPQRSHRLSFGEDISLGDFLLSFLFNPIANTDWKLFWSRALSRSILGPRCPATYRNGHLRLRVYHMRYA